MHAPKAILPGAVFQLRQDLGELAADLELRNLEWGILFAVTGEHTVAQIGHHFGVDPGERDAAFRRLEAAGLIEERPLRQVEYLRAVATLRDEEPKGLARFLRAGAVGRAAGPPVVSPEERSAPVAVADTPSADSLAPASVPAPSGPAAAGGQTASDEIGALMEALGEIPFDHQTRAVPTVSRDTLSRFEPLDRPSPGPAPAGQEHSPPPLPTLAAPAAVPGTPPPAPRLSVKALMQHILDRAPDLTAGQLDVYRVFIRINTKLLRRNGITTLRFEDDHLVSDPELQDALVSSLRRTLGLEVPRHVFI